MEPNQQGISRPSGAKVVLEAMYAFLAIGSVALWGLRASGWFTDEFNELAKLIDDLICLLFLGQAVWSLWMAPNKLRWLKWGWADFAASIPEVEALRALRGLRLLLMIRVYRSTMRSVHGFITLFNAGRAKSVAAVVFALIVISIITSSFLILGMESTSENANIKTAEDALLWAISTLTGAEPIGFGDHYPTTTGGRLVTLWLVVVSLGLIGTLAGLISAWIEEEPKSE